MPPLTVGDSILAGLASTVAPIVLRVLGASWRLSVEGADVIDRVHEGGRSAVHAFWHCHILPLEFAYRGRGIHVLSSWHRDGEISARLMTALGYGVLRGSSTRGYLRGTVDMIAAAREGWDLAVTPDGPRGPARVAKTGVFLLSDKAAAPVIPAAAAASRFRRLSSWDGFIVPAPFARVAIVHGEPIEPVPPERYEGAADALSVTLNELQERARRLVDARD